MMTIHIWIRLSSQGFRSIAILAILAVGSLFWEFLSKIGELKMDGSVRVLVTFGFFFLAASSCSYLFCRDSRVVGHRGTGAGTDMDTGAGVDASMLVSRSVLVFWVVTLASCAACLVLRILDLAISASSLLGFDNPAAISAVALSAIAVTIACSLCLSHRRMIGLSVVKLDTARLDAAGGRRASVHD